MQYRYRNRLLRLALLSGVGSFLFLCTANAQVRCPEGRTGSGACINTPLASGMRQTSIIFSQPKISQTAYPILPVLDFRYRYPNQLTQVPIIPTPIAGPPIP